MGEVKVGTGRRLFVGVDGRGRCRTEEIWVGGFRSWLLCYTGTTTWCTRRGEVEGTGFLQDLATLAWT